MQIGGLVLCGGESRRMGTPKAWLCFQGERMLQRVVRILQEVVDPLAVAAAPEQDVPPLPLDVMVARDACSGRGPLQGLATGLAALPERVEAAFVCSCDAPFLQPAFVQHLVGLLEAYDAVVPQEGDFYHPLTAVYRTSILPEIEALLRENRRRMIALFDRCRVRTVGVETLRAADPDLLSLQNMNTPEDYQAALDRLEKGGDMGSL